jgi:hypothetical protein
MSHIALERQYQIHFDVSLSEKISITNLMNRHKVIKDDYYQNIYDDYQAKKLTVAEIAQKYNISHTSVYNAKKYIEQNNPGNTQNQEKNVRRNKPNMDQSQVAELCEKSWELYNTKYSETKQPIKQPVKQQPKISINTKIPESKKNKRDRIGQEALAFLENHHKLRNED